MNHFFLFLRDLGLHIGDRYVEYPGVSSSEARYSGYKCIKDFGPSEKIFFRKKGLDKRFLL